MALYQTDIPKRVFHFDLCTSSYKDVVWRSKYVGSAIVPYAKLKHFSKTDIKINQQYVECITHHRLSLLNSTGEVM